MCLCTTRYLTSRGNTDSGLSDKGEEYVEPTENKKHEDEKKYIHKATLLKIGDL
jgi:hypothetical protein